jgi:phosphosulfolactate synthase
MTFPSFLDVPNRPAKPRAVGLTHVLDKGTDVGAASGIIDSGGPYIDIWKLGWGTAYVEPTLAPKLSLLAGRGIRSCLGGTLLEIAWTQHKADECLAWAAQVGFAAIEVSRGVATMSLADKQALIRDAGSTFTVLSEVGRKDEREQMSEREWAEEMAGDLAAGARWVIAEGRESGSVGIYRDDGTVRADIVAAITRVAGLDTVLFEAPRKDQQAWFIKQYGPDVNLANVALTDAVPLETLRLGLRADTFGVSWACLSR